MNISKYNSRGGDFESREDRPAPIGGATAIDSDRRPAEDRRPTEGRPPIHPPVAKNDDDFLRNGLHLRAQRTQNDVKSNSILPDGCAQEFKQLPLDNRSTSLEPNQFIPDEKIVLRLNKPFKSQASNPIDSQTDSINIRADDSQSNRTNNQFNFPFPKRETSDSRRPKHLTKINSKATSPHSSKSNDSPATKWEQTAKFGQCATSMSYSISPGLASQARNQGVTLTPRSGGQQPVTQFQKQDRQFDFCLTPAQAPDDETAGKQRTALEEELERERTRMKEANEAWRREMEE